ncbi:hypothetical protein [Flavobacterium frigoris]|uniref:Uncharacterized protein n=1 Tax=Flavobacterium frigoris (strain PS1) TaxID=1086011 RepID=H7FM79_FLAFP|nr:hypothetical protein [Flavobacterium frigoris]EIA10417.1 hypothetical protein HJ01_00277 [Flavobacterium frigoris PS1]
MAEEVFNKILQSHTCVHFHPNNCIGIDVQMGIEIPKIAESTFLRKDRIQYKKHQTVFPHELDYDNTDRNHIVVPKNWHK